ncbi:MAG: metal-sensitive transcriptional regulator [Gammaproteobacteria bacterium]|nr:metal-sensitive transcriptional regulator [Gammaproteobacteria bacterium]
MKKHPDHSEQLKRIARARGQLDGVSRMIDEGRYCVDILTQLRAARSALRAVEDAVLKTHVQHCVKDALEGGDEADARARIDELTDVLTRYSR